MQTQGCGAYRHGMSTSLIEYQYSATRRVYRCFMLAPVTLGISIIFGLMAGHIARPELAPRFVRHIDYLHRSLVLGLAFLAFVLGGWALTEQMSGGAGLAAGLSGTILFYAMRIHIGWRALVAMHAIDFPHENSDAST